MRNMKTAPFALPNTLSGRSAEHFTAGSSIFASRQQVEKNQSSHFTPTSLPQSPQYSQQPALDCQIKDRIEELSSTQAKFTEIQDNFTMKVDEQSRVTNDISNKIDRLVAGMVSQEQFLKLVQSVDTLTSQNRKLIDANNSLKSRFLDAADIILEADQSDTRLRNHGPSQARQHRKTALPQNAAPLSEDVLNDAPANYHRASSPRRKTAKSQSRCRNIHDNSSVEEQSIIAPVKLTAGALALQQAEEISQQEQHRLEPNFSQEEYIGNNQCKNVLQDDSNSCDDEGSEVLSVLPPSKKGKVAHADMPEHEEVDGEQSPFMGDSSDEEESDMHVMDLNTWMKSTGRSRCSVKGVQKGDMPKGGNFCSSKGYDELQRGSIKNISSAKSTSGSGCSNQAPKSMVCDSGGDESCFLFRDEESDNDCAGDLEEHNSESDCQGHKFFPFTTSSISQDF